METVTDFIFLGFKIPVDGDCSHEIKGCLLLERKAMTNRQHIKKQRHYFANKGPSRQGYGFSCGHVWMWELDCEESWAPKSWCFWTVVLEKTLESPLVFKEIQSVNPIGNQSWIFIGRTDAEVEAPIVWPPDAKSQLIEKTMMLEKFEGRKSAPLLVFSWMLYSHQQSVKKESNVLKLRMAPGPSPIRCILG